MDATTCRWFVLAVVLAYIAVEDVTGDYTMSRSKRDLMQLGNMISSVTGKGLLSVYTSYNNYGCYCGLGGKGTPVDDVDRCCQQHDRCFGAAQKRACSSSKKKTVYNQSYKYSVNTKGVRAKIECASVSSYTDVAEGYCAQALCECDRYVATCFVKHKLKQKYSSYDRKKCK